MLFTLLALTTACLATGCAIPRSSDVTIPNIQQYIVQYKCPSGTAPFSTNCSESQLTPQNANDIVKFSKHDWPKPKGYQASDDALDANNNIIKTFQFGPPFGTFSSNSANGGDYIQVIGNAAVVAKTQDGGTPAMQYFVGPNCGGTGWVLFRNTVLNNQWESEVARLSDVSSPTQCPSLGSSFTRYMTGKLVLPFYDKNKQLTLSLPTIISEHYNNRSLADSKALERFYFQYPFGNDRWEAWSRTLQPSVDLTPRCPAINYDSSAPLTNFSFQPNNDSSWHLIDCRTWTNIVETKPHKVAQFGWPETTTLRKH